VLQLDALMVDYQASERGPTDLVLDETSHALALHMLRDLLTEGLQGSESQMNALQCLLAVHS